MIQHLEVRAHTSWLGTRIMSQNVATCLYTVASVN